MKVNKIRDLKITTLAENLVQRGGLGQWGLSFLLEFYDAEDNERKVILDTSTNKETLFHNIKHLELDLGEVDCLVLSHGHYDHTSANVEVVEAAGGIKVYGHPHTFLPRIFQNKKGKRRQVGVPEGQGAAEIEAAGGELVLSSSPVEVVPGLWTTGPVERVSFERTWELSEGERMIVVVDDEELDDVVLDDQALWSHVEGVGQFVVTGCAHAGPVNTLHQVQRLGGIKEIYGMVGGTHLFGRSDEYVDQTVNEFRGFEMKLISPCHCTGFKTTATLWRAFPEEFVLNFVCRKIEVGKEPKRRII